MKATLLPRKNVRLMWFKAENLKFEVARKVEFSYSTYEAQNDEVSRTPQFQYIFPNVPKQVPASQIIMFNKALGLPQFYSRTEGSVGTKLATVWDSELELEIKDRIVTYTKSDETVKVEPPESHLAHKIKEVQIKEQDHFVARKLTLKNLSDKPMLGVLVKFTETKEVRFESSKAEVFQRDPPEYVWKVDVPADGPSVIEFTVKFHTVKTFTIEKEIPKVKVERRRYPNQQRIG